VQTNRVVGDQEILAAWLSSLPQGMNSATAVKATEATLMKIKIAKVT
jgi:hypothetical protein